MWTLVFLIFIEGELLSNVISSHQDMFQCFHAREQLSFQVGGENGYFPPDKQAICVLRDSTPT